jgi:hypothetical protein
MLRYNRLTGLVFRLHIVNRIKVYRLENVQGLGPYHALPFQVKLWSDRDHEVIECAPSLAKDGIGTAFNGHGLFRFGFYSLTTWAI